MPDLLAPVNPPAEMRPDGRAPRSSINSAQLIIAIGVALTLVYVARLVLITLMLSILVAFALAPVRDVLERFKLRRALSSLITVLLMLALLYGAVEFSYTQASSFLQKLPQYSSRIRAVLVSFRQQAESLRRTTESVLPEDEPGPRATLVTSGSSWGWLTEGLGPVTEVLLALSFVPFLVYFMLSWQSHVRSATVMLFHLENRNTAYTTLGMVASMMRGFVAGNLLIALVLSVICTVVFAVAGLPFFYFVGPISGFLSLVPYTGAVLAVVPPLLVGLGQIPVETAFVLVFTVFLLHVFALNVLYPKLLGNRLQLNPLAATIALLFWGWMWGGMGLLLAIPITGALKIVFDNVERLRPYGDWLGR
jgi:predicted PurR-regulated permease PerM